MVEILLVIICLGLFFGEPLSKLKSHLFDKKPKFRYGALSQDEEIQICDLINLFFINIEKVCIYKANREILLQLSEIRLDLELATLTLKITPTHRNNLNLEDVIFGLTRKEAEDLFNDILNKKQEVSRNIVLKMGKTQMFTK